MILGKHHSVPLGPFDQAALPIILAIIQILNIAWVIRCLLQVLRVDSIPAGWKLYWQAVIYFLPVFGPLIWMFSSHNPGRIRIRRPLRPRAKSKE